MISAAAIFLSNVILLLIALADRSWIAFGIGIVFGPITNIGLVIVALAFMIWVKRLARGAAIMPYGLVSILLPLLAIPADFALISSMGLHGC
jgi:hypothetical protein